MANHPSNQAGRFAKTRFLWVNRDDADYVRQRLDFAGCRMLLRVDRQTKNRQGQTIRETRYFISSLDPATTTPSQLLKDVRGHGSRRPGLAERLASLTNVALTLLRLEAGEKIGMRTHADESSWSPLHALKLLGALD
jgi:hypothetical protein